MPRSFLFDPDLFDVPPIVKFIFTWENIPDSAACNAIAVEHQYLEFHRYMLGAIRHADPKDPVNSIPLGLSVRAGMIKAAISLYASIAEAALRAHAEKRGIKLHPNKTRRTFGAVIYAWEADSVHFSTIQPIWDDLVALLESRNMIHLFKSIETNRDFQDIIQGEEPVLNSGEKVLSVLQKIRSP